MKIWLHDSIFIAPTLPLFHEKQDEKKAKFFAYSVWPWWIQILAGTFCWGELAEDAL